MYENLVNFYQIKQEYFIQGYYHYVLLKAAGKIKGKGFCRSISAESFFLLLEKKHVS